MIAAINVLNNWIKKDELVNDFKFVHELHEAIKDQSFEISLAKKELFTEED